MDRLPEVEAAKALMNEAISWSVMKWLREKKRVRQTADDANAALDRLTEATRARWDEGVRGAYEALARPGSDRAAANKRRRPSEAANPEAARIARGIKEADDKAYQARLEAEKTFDAAEKQLSTALAREGCRKAIEGWELHERAIRKAEAAVR